MPEPKSQSRYLWEIADIGSFILEEDMSNRCVDCKFHYSDYEWDEVDEENYLIDICGAGHTEYIESSE